MTDTERERAIESCRRRMLDSTGNERREWADAMTALIKSRSPEQVARMETERFGAPLA